MKILLPFILASVVYLAPLYPIYAQTTGETAPASAAPSVKRIARPSVASATAKLKDAAKERMEDRKGKVEERIDNVKDRLATRSAELKAKLLKFKDKTKATKVEKINTNLNAINTSHTTQMTNSLTKISQVLAKLKTWVAEKEAAGTDVTELKTAITDTEVAWTVADSAVKDQADNDYTIAVNTEATVKTDAQNARDALRTDLKAAHAKLVAAKQTLSTALGSWRGGSK